MVNEFDSFSKKYRLVYPRKVGYFSGGPRNQTVFCHPVRKERTSHETFIYVSSPNDAVLLCSRMVSMLPTVFWTVLTCHSNVDSIFDFSCNLLHLYLFLLFVHSPDSNISLLQHYCAFDQESTDICGHQHSLVTCLGIWLSLYHSSLL